MESFAAVGSLGDLALLLGISSTRVAAAFLLVPLFTQELVPPLVRNALFLAIALLSLAMHPVVEPLRLSTWQWVTLFGKEAFIGATIGFMFAVVMWAFEAAGQVIDMKAGTSMAQVLDPLSGHQTSPNGAFLARLASWVFMAGGGFMLMIGALMESYAMWPVTQPLPGLARAGSQLFESEFGRVMVLTLVVAGPALVLLYVIDGVLGLINRFAQQLNVSSLATSVKAVAAVWILWIQAATLVRLLQDDLMGRGAAALGAVRTLVQ